MPPQLSDFANNDEDDETRWFPVREPESVSVIVHGLNMKPNRMEDLVAMQNDMRSDVLRITMTGHSPGKRGWSFVRRADWLDDIRHGLDDAAEHAEKLGVPLHGIGYSMGGQYLADALSSSDGAAEKTVLIAPSIALRPDAQFNLRIARLLGPLPTPSSLDPYYRANRLIPGSAYSAMAASQEALEETGANDVPTLVLLDPEDEWICEEGTQDFIRRHGLKQWGVQLIQRAKESLKGRWHHLIHDKRSLAEHWEEVSSRIHTFLSKDLRTQ